MPLDLLDFNFRRFSHDELIERVERIVVLCEVHPGLNPWPEEVASLAELRELYLDFAAAVEAAEEGGDQVEERDQKRKRLELELTMVGQAIVIRSIRRRDLSILHDNGFETKKRPVQTTAATAPLDFRVKHGPQAGMIIARATTVPGVGSYEVQVSQDPECEDSWQSVGHYIHPRHMEIKNLEPAHHIYLRARCHGATGPGPWCAPVSIIVL